MNNEDKNIFSGLILKYVEINGNEETRVYLDDRGIEHRYIKNYDMPSIDYYVRTTLLERRIQKAIEYIKETKKEIIKDYDYGWKELIRFDGVLDILEGNNE